jgi:hypothetical protein
LFLTAPDTERLNIRGSRDPLGLVPLWGDFGRKVVGNLTTASNSVRGFTTLLLGLHFAERVANGEEDLGRVRLDAFLIFEQLAGFVRVIRNDDENMRGITQIKHRLEDSEGRHILIGSAPELQILSNQKTYGLWGLFTIPAIESGLVVPKDLVLTPVARELVEREYLPILRKHGLGDGKSIEDLLSRSRSELDPNGRHAKLFDALGKILSPAIRKGEYDTYHYHLLRGGPKVKSSHWQPRFTALVEQSLSPNDEFDHESLTRVITAAAKFEGDTPLRQHLMCIRDLESVLVALGNLFGFLQNRDGAKVQEVTAELKKTWGDGLGHIKPTAIEEMQADVSRVYGDNASGERFVALAKSLHGGDFAASIDLVLAHNQFVMHARHGAEPWIQRRGESLTVRYSDESQATLMIPRQLATVWRSGFYMNPLKLVSNELRRGA